MGETPSLDEIRLRDVFRALHRHEVDYAVIGAVALGLHGLARATGDVDLFVRPEVANIERLKAALRSVFADPSIDDIRADDLCGDYPAVRYLPPDGFGFDLVTRLGEAVTYTELEVEVKVYDDVPVRVVTPRTRWQMKKDTVRPLDRLDAAALAERFGLENSSMPVYRYRSVEAMAPPWRHPADPDNLRFVGEMLRFYRRFSAAEERPRGVRRYRTMAALNDDRGDPYRRAPAAKSVAG